MLLVLDCWAMARSAAAMVQGYQAFDADLTFAGLLLNKVLVCISLECWPSRPCAAMLPMYARACSQTGAGLAVLSAHLSRLHCTQACLCSEVSHAAQVGGAAHTTWLQEALTAGGVTLPVLSGIPKVLFPAEQAA